MDIKFLHLTPKRQKICSILGLKTSDDLLHYYPLRYSQHYCQPFNKWRVKQEVLFAGLVISDVSTFYFRKRMARTTFRVLYDKEELKITIFNRPWLRLTEKVTILGIYEGNNRINATQIYPSKKVSDLEGIEVIYPLKEGVKQSDIRSLMKSVLPSLITQIKDVVPFHLQNKYHLINYQKALTNIHFPSDVTNLKLAIAYLKYQELLSFYCTLALQKKAFAGIKKEKKISKSKIKAFIKSLPFILTNDQNNAINEIIADLEKPQQMNRLLEGEVGCGKTIVALIAVVANYLAGYQSTIMAPTEILAKQHYEEALKYLLPFGLKVALLTANTYNSEEIRMAIATNNIDLVIGTHSLLTDKTKFMNLGLVITDEQQRFGVDQRRKLKEKGPETDFLLLSATPIPRTLASTLFGDCDLSTIATLPKDRAICSTVLIPLNSIKTSLEEISLLLAQGRQMYVVAPSIEQNETLTIKDVNRLTKAYQDLFPSYKVASLHGKQNSIEKMEIMEAFAQNMIRILVTTTVVEVGINVKNATIMVIYNAERFGLAQLHQLRGRIQRSSTKGYCYLLSDSSDEKALMRLEAFCHNNDGFAIAKEDLNLRGPGDLLGTKQSGLPTLSIANPLKDTNIAQAAYRDSKLLLQSNLKEDLAFLQILKEEFFVG